MLFYFTQIFCKFFNSTKKFKEVWQISLSIVSYWPPTPYIQALTDLSWTAIKNRCALLPDNKLLQLKMGPGSTLDKPAWWRYLEATTYFLSCLLFFIGSFLLLPFIPSMVEISRSTAWLYLIGTANYIISMLMIWSHMEPKFYSDQKQATWCMYPTLSFNHSLNVIGGTVLFFSCLMGLPSIGMSAMSSQLTLVATSIIIISNSWKFLRMLLNQTLTQELKQDKYGLYTLLAATLGVACYFVSNLLSLQQVPVAKPAVDAVAVVGGMLLLVSGLAAVIRNLGVEQRGNSVKDEASFGAGFSTNELPQ